MTKTRNYYPSFAEEKKLWRKGFKLVIGVDEVGRGSWAGPVVAAAAAFSFARGPVGLRPHPTSSLGRRGGLTAGARWGSPAPATPRFSPLDEILKLGINDSKALSSQKRKQLAEIIKECSIWAVAEVGVGVINKVGIGKATQMAMRKAVGKVIKILRYEDIKKKNKKSPNILISQYPNIFLLSDAFHIRYLRGVSLKNQKAIIKGDQKSISIAAASILAKVYRDNLMKKLAERYPRYGWARNKGYGTKEHQKAILKYRTTRLHRKAFVGTFLKRLARATK